MYKGFGFDISKLLSEWQARETSEVEARQAGSLALERANTIKSFAIPQTASKAFTRADECLSEIRSILYGSEYQTEQDAWSSFRDEHEELDQASKHIQNAIDLGKRKGGGGGDGPNDPNDPDSNWWEKLVETVKKFFDTLCKHLSAIANGIKNVVTKNEKIVKAWNVFYEQFLKKFASWSFDRIMEWFLGK